MTQSTQELAALQAELAALKAAKEEEATAAEAAALRQELERLKAQPAAVPTGDLEKTREIKSSRVRCWGVAVAHFFFPPAASAVYCSKTGKWLPFAVGTGVAFAGIPLAIFDLGLTAAIGAPVTSAVMIINQVQEDRRKNKFTLPEEADAAFFSRF